MNNKKPLLLPDILTYKSALDYLHDYLKYRKSLDPQFTHEIWSAELNYKSKSFLRMVCVGKRNITQDLVQKISKKLCFSEKQEQHFTLLALIKQTPAPIMKSIYTDTFLKSLDLDKNRKKVESEDFLSSLHIPLAYMLISFDDFTATEKNLGKMLGVNRKNIQQIITKLQNLDLIEELDTKEKIWKTKNKAFKFEGGKNKEKSKDFHRKSITEALTKLSQDDQSDLLKRFRSIYFSIPENLQPDLYAEVEDFLRKIRNKYGSNHLSNQQIVKMNLQYYSVTDIYNN